MKIDSCALLMAMARKRFQCGELAKKAGVSLVTITKARNGGKLSAASVGKIARALAVDPAEIIEREATP